MILPHHFWYQLMLFFSEQVELLSLCKSNQKLLLYTKSLKQVYFFPFANRNSTLNLCSYMIQSKRHIVLPPIDRKYWWIFTGRKFSVNWENINLFTRFFQFFLCSVTVYCLLQLQMHPGWRRCVAHHKGACRAPPVAKASSIGVIFSAMAAQGRNLHTAEDFSQLLLLCAANWRNLEIIIHVFFLQVLNRIIDVEAL